jgi:hypothetical protein
VPPSGAILGSDFLLSSEDWIIVGNMLKSQQVIHEKYSIGILMSNFISGVDDNANVLISETGESEINAARWYFSSPVKFKTNLGMSYGGFLNFTQIRIAGDFSNLNSNVILLYNVIKYFIFNSYILYSCI